MTLIHSFSPLARIRQKPASPRVSVCSVPKFTVKMSTRHIIIVIIITDAKYGSLRFVVLHAAVPAQLTLPLPSPYLQYCFSVVGVCVRACVRTYMLAGRQAGRLDG